MRHPTPLWPLVGLSMLSTLVLFPLETTASGTRDPGICASSPVYTTHYPGWSAAPRIPWTETMNHRIAGFLFFAAKATGPDSLMHTRGQMPNGSATKILWYVRIPGGNRTLILTGTRIGGEDTMRQEFKEVSPPKNYPSIVNIPVAGCWKLSLQSGHVRGTVVMHVVDAEASGGQQLLLALTPLASSSRGSNPNP